LKTALQASFPDFTFIQAFDWFEIGYKITQKKPGFILLDASLEGVDISGFIRTAKGEPFFGKPIIFLLADSQKTGNGANSQADLVLTKPLDYSKLEAAIKSFEKQFDTATA